MSLEEFYSTNKLDPEFDWVEYTKRFPEVVDFYQPHCKENGIDDAHRLYYHCHKYNYTGYVSKPLPVENLKPCTDNEFALPQRFRDDNFVSAVTVTTGRKQMLDLSIKSWLAFSEIEEVVVVCWNFNTWLDDVESVDSRIKTINVHSTEKFNISKAYNIGIQAARYSRVLKLDVDYILNPYYNMFSNVNLKNNMFITGSDGVKNDFIKGLNGFLFIHKHNFMDVGGYNEHMQGYGWEDSDLQYRLVSAGLKRCTLPEEIIYVYHNPHGDEIRTENYENKNIRRSIVLNMKLTERGANKWLPRFEHISVINLNDVNSRYKQYRYIDPRMNRFAAVDSRVKKLICEDFGLHLNPVGLVNRLYFSFSPGAVGCYMSHYLLWKKMLEDDIDCMLILEDDAHPRDVSEFVKSNVKFSGTYDLVQLNKRTCLNYDGYLTQFNGTESYLLSKSGAEKLINMTHDPSPLQGIHKASPCDGYKDLRPTSYKCYTNELEQNWHVKDCITAPVDKFIGYCTNYNLPDSCRLRVYIDHKIGLLERNGGSRVLSRGYKPVWECTEPEVESMINSEQFMWWETQ